MRNRPNLSLMGCAYLSSVTACHAGTIQEAPDTAPAPNVLFICVDDLRPQIGSYGNAQMQTPHLDQLATRSTLFERAYCQFAVCGPSRASVLSGMYPERNGIRDNATSFRAALPHHLSLPEHFRDHGYTTVGMGKIFHHMANTDRRSWDRWVDIEGRSYFLQENLDAQKQRRAAIAAREAAGETFTPHQKYVLTSGPFSESADADERLYPDGELASQAIQVLRDARETGQPFFLAVGFLKPHLPFVVPRAYWDIYDADSFSIAEPESFPEGAPTWHTHESFELRGYSDVPLEGPYDADVLRRAIHGYYAACSFVDAQIGRVLGELERLGLTENTIVIVWGDNGFHLGENGIIGKDTNFEAAAHCPLIIAAPFQEGLAGAQRVSAPVELLDIFPTLCELAGLPTPAQVEGVSLLTLMRHPDQPASKPAFTMNERLWNSPYSGYAMRTDRYRYIRWQDPDRAMVAEELYDYSRSPRETHNVIGDPAYAAVAEALRDQFDKESPL